jgi:hypothetical protein
MVQVGSANDPPELALAGGGLVHRGQSVALLKLQILGPIQPLLESRYRRRECGTRVRMQQGELQYTGTHV